MSLKGKLLAGLSFIALLAVSGIGLQRLRAEENEQAAAQQTVPVPPLATMSLAELAGFVAGNINGTAASPTEAATQFGRLLAQVNPAGESQPASRMAVANALQFMLEELLAHYGAFDAEAVLATARVAYLAALPTAAGPETSSVSESAGPDFDQNAVSHY